MTGCRACRCHHGAGIGAGDGRCCRAVGQEGQQRQSWHSIATAGEAHAEDVGAQLVPGVPLAHPTSVMATGASAELTVVVYLFNLDFLQTCAVCCASYGFLQC